MQQNTDPTQKYGTPQSAPSSKLVWMGWMMIGIGLIWLFSGSLSVFLWIIRDFGQENVWTEILLQGHIALAMNALVIVAGILMLKGKRSGYVMALASCIYWVGSALFFLFYIFVQYFGVELSSECFVHGDVGNQCIVHCGFCRFVQS